MLKMSALIYKYNLHIKGSDNNTQIKASYQSKIRART